MTPLTVINQSFNHIDVKFNEAINPNVRAVHAIIAACQSAIPFLEERPGSSIINVGSIAGNDGAGQELVSTPLRRHSFTTSRDIWLAI